MNIKLAKTEIIHFIGIGGIGMSGLAIIMKRLGFEIQGSDAVKNKNIDRLKKNKIKVTIGHKKRNLEESTIVVISSAIKNNNPEIIQAKKKKLPIYKRGEMLGQVVSLMKNIVVVGSHGKTTTTSLISSIFSKTNIDATTINGGVLRSFSSSARLGKSNWCILELDESDGSFLEVPPTYSIITNLDAEHLDYYKSLKNLKSHFLKFINNTPSFGKCFICIDNKNNKSLISKITNKNFSTYGFNYKSNFKIYNVKQNTHFSKFDIQVNLPNIKKKIIKNIEIPLIGHHNISNATAALAIAYSIGIPNSVIKKGLKHFKGVERRFNYLFKYRNSIFIDDYAHHPTEITEVLKGVKEVYSKKEIICIFQPHRISRLQTLANEFSKSFLNAHKVVLCPIFKAGENIKLKINYTNFAKKIIKNSKVELINVNNQIELYKYIKQCIFDESIIIGMGAGSISTWMREMPKNIK